MKRLPLLGLVLGFGVLGSMGWMLANAAPAPGEENLRKAARAQFEKGNFADALAEYRKLLADPQTQPTHAAEDLRLAVQCLQRLGRIFEFDALVEQAVATHAENWHLLKAAAEQYLAIDHFGYRKAGEFSRGYEGGEAEFVNSERRDRVRAMQLLRQALPLAQRTDRPGDAAEVLMALAEALHQPAAAGEAWRLQTLTELEFLPDYELTEPWLRWHWRQRTYAPVDAEGNPIFYHVPESWDAAVNDGQRWRWALAEAARTDPARSFETSWLLAAFCQSQFGEQTLADYGWFTRADADQTDTSGTYALHTLGENETIARLAIGIRRFELPDEFNYIRIYQQLAEQGNAAEARPLRALSEVFLNRRQYPRAADYLRQGVERVEGQPRRWFQAQLDQVVKPWGRFEPRATQAAGTAATVDFRFRNGKQLKITAHELKLELLLSDLKTHLRGDPARLDWNQLQVDNLGYRLVARNQSRYLGPLAAEWTEQLEPRPAHVDSRTTIDTPLTKPGAYLLTAELEGGNTSRIVLWVADTALVQKSADEGTWLYVADAVTGAPIDRANIEFLGYRHVEDLKGSRRIEVQNYALRTDETGQVLAPRRERDDDAGQFQWMYIARTDTGRLAFLGFQSYWYRGWSESRYEQTRAFVISDRPVYRPNQTVQFKVWLGQGRYGDDEQPASFAERRVKVEILDPQGEKVLERTYTTDRFGGLEGNLELPSNARLGQYYVNVPDYSSGGQFRVEEYKKPEFEVTVAGPERPIALGEKFEATIAARYYFGAPVTHARVKYKITRTAHDSSWFAPTRWDWLYGRGWWWTGHDYTWYPGFQSWGCLAPPPWWWHGGYEQPEVVAEAEAEIGDNGTVQVAIDTQLAKEMHGNRDHAYTITAEVTDQSRRTIVGTGRVLVARQPFRVHVWVDRGFYRTGDTIRVHAAAQTIDQRPVTGEGVLRLLSIAYTDGKPVETEVERWSVAPGANGQIEQPIVAGAPGQYRLSYTVTEAGGAAIEGGYVLTVIGPEFDGAGFRFDDLELVPDRRDYAPGDTVQLQINTNRAGSTVLLFVRPVNSVYPRPQLVRLAGKSTVVEIGVTAADMPNFFVEAVTVADGRVHQQARQILVPPEERIVDVAIESSQREYLPGEQAEVKVTLTGPDGRPFTGSTVVAIYDKALEYISGGSNVADIREFFWKWQRNHSPKLASNLYRSAENQLKPKEVPMQDLGLFGATAVEELRRDRDANKRQSGVALGFNGIAGSAELRGVMPVAAAAESDAVSTINGPWVVQEELAPLLGGEAGGGPLVDPAVRSKFADTALWVAGVETDGDGVAVVRLTMPDNLTTWLVRTWAMGSGTRVGQGTSELVTTKNLLVRLQAPRFFVETDEVVLSANVHNYLDQAKQVQVSLELEGDVLVPLEESTRTVEVAAGGEARVDWRVRAVAEGEALVRMKALTDVESDAMEMRFPVLVHGMLRTDAFSGVIRPGDASAQVTFTVPQERRPADSRVEIRWSPTLAGAMVDALPYLVDYPYGCTEQTLSRFLPTVITQRILIDLGIDLKQVRDKRTNLNAQQLGDPAERARQWQRFDRNPVFDSDEVAQMTRDGVQRLTEMQLSDGGWGWFSGYGERSNAHTTAWVVHGLQIAAGNDVALVPGMLDRGIEWLRRYQAEQVRLLDRGKGKKAPYKTTADNLDALVYLVLVDADYASHEMFEYLSRDRVALGAYGKALFGLALATQGKTEQLNLVLDNLRQFVEQDDENQTAFLRLPSDNPWWFWHGSQIEAMAWYVQLLSRVEPQGELAPRLVKYLLNNRRHGTYWNSTRDTALCVEALATFLTASGESQPDMTVELWLDGQMHKSVHVGAGDLFTFDNKLVLTGEEVTSGQHVLEVRRRGAGPVYFNAYVTNFTLEDPIASAGLEVRVDRRMWKLIPEQATADVAGQRGQVIGQRVEKFRREELSDLATLASGELVEVELLIESKNDYEYLMVEDFKAAGFEPVDVRSGYTGNPLGAYVEFRDTRVAFFATRLPRGTSSVTYRLRAEIPGRFSALPTVVQGMYAPELRGNSDEIKLQIEDRPQQP